MISVQVDKMINHALSETERKLISVEIQADENRVLIQSMECSNGGDIKLEETSNLDFNVKNSYSLYYDGSKEKTEMVLSIIDELSKRGAEFYDIVDTTEYNDTFKRSDLIEKSNDIIISHTRSYV